MIINPIFIPYTDIVIPARSDCARVETDYGPPNRGGSLQRAGDGYDNYYCALIVFIMRHR